MTGSSESLRQCHYWDFFVDLPIVFEIQHLTKCIDLSGQISGLEKVRRNLPCVYASIDSNAFLSKPAQQTPLQ